MTDFDRLLQARNQRKQPQAVLHDMAACRLHVQPNGTRELVWLEDDVMTGLEEGTLQTYPVTDLEELERVLATKSKPWIEPESEPLVQSNGHPVQSSVKTVQTLF